MTILECPPLEGDRVQRMYETLDEWLRSPALASLITSFGSEIPSHLTTVDLGAWLLDFSEQWDFRKLQEGTLAEDTGERSRWLITDTSLTQSQRSIVMEAARELGLIGMGFPGKNAYDFVWVLGGARLSNLLRPRFAAHLLTEHALQCGGIALLASGRPVSSTERHATDTYAPEAETEFDLINRGAEIAFNMPPSFTEERYDDAKTRNHSWIIRRYDKTGDFPPILSMSAPSSEPETRRANSADTYEFFFDNVQVPPGSSLLLITSQIYVPYQQLEAIRTVALRHNVVLETVGFPLDWNGDLQGMNQPGNYLQEVRSTIQSANRFFSAFPRR
jgi:hypothetical protein